MPSSPLPLLPDVRNLLGVEPCVIFLITPLWSRQRGFLDLLSLLVVLPVTLLTGKRFRKLVPVGGLLRLYGHCPGSVSRQGTPFSKGRVLDSECEPTSASIG